MPKLDARLKTVMALIEALPVRTHTHADIGSDHGGLLKALLDCGYIDRGIAIENKRGPYLNSVNTLADVNANVRFGDGLEAVEPGEADSLSICGLGAKTIVEILEKFPDRIPKHVVLQPVKNPEFIRDWIQQVGYEMLSEQIVDGQRSYTVFSIATPNDHANEANGVSSFAKPTDIHSSGKRIGKAYTLPTTGFKFFRRLNSMPDLRWVSSTAPFCLKTTDKCFGTDSLPDTFLRAVATERILPTKEVFETFEFFEEIRKLTRSPLVVDLCCGHGLLGILFAMFEPKVDRVILIDKTELPSRGKLISIASKVAPWVGPKVESIAAKITLEDDWIESGCSIVSAHACGTLSDLCIDIAIKSEGPIAILPCCYPQSACRAPLALQKSLGLETAFDVDRTYRLEVAGYRVRWSEISELITPMNRILVGKRQ